MDKRIEKIRTEERNYHEACYENYKLFEAGSWLYKPVKTVMEYVAAFDDREYLSVLDLGSGVGRNSIPIAEKLKVRSGKVVCVDIMETAINKLMSYAQQYGIIEYIEPRVSDIGDFIVAEEEFDYIIAVSSLEHVKSEQDFVDLLNRMVKGTKSQGINCIIMNTNIEEIDAHSGEHLEPMMELNMTPAYAKRLLSAAYQGWELLRTDVRTQEFEIERNGQEISLKSDCLTYVAKKVRLI